MQTQVPQGLQALIALKQGMQTGQVQRVAPDGRTPTVAEQLTQQAEQSMAPPEPEAPGMPGMLPVAEQASQGMQVQAHQQEQEQNRMKELLERMAQSRPDPSQQGIAAAAPDMNYADGGIVGFSGNAGSVPGEEKPNAAQVGAGPGSEYMREKLMGARLNTATISPEEELRRAIAAREMNRRLLQELGIPDANAMQQKAFEEQKAREEQRRAEYEAAKKERFGITSPGFAKALAAFASAPRRQAFAQMGMNLANEREGFSRADLAESERRRKFADEMERAKILDAQGRGKEAMDVKNKATADFYAQQSRENEGVKFKTEVAGKLYGPTLQAETAELDREARALEGKLGRQSSERSAAMRQRGFTEEVLAEYLRLQKIDPAKAEEYLQAVQKVRGASEADRLAVTAQSKANKELSDFMTSMPYVQLQSKPSAQKELLKQKKEQLMKQYPGVVFDTNPASDLSQWGELKVNKP